MINTSDLKKFDVPTPIIHGDDDQIVPISAAPLIDAGQGLDPENPHGRAPWPC